MISLIGTPVANISRTEYAVIDCPQCFCCLNNKMFADCKELIKCKRTQNILLHLPHGTWNMLILKAHSGKAL